MSTKKLLSEIEWPFVFATLAVLVSGLLTLYSANYDKELGALKTGYFYNQLLWVGAGFIVILFFTLLNHQFLGKMGWVFYIINVALLVFVLVKSRSILGAKRWIEFGFFSLQPSELMKITIIIILAKYLSRENQPNSIGLTDLFVPGLIIGVPALLVLKQPDLGTAIIICAISFGMLLYAGLNYRAIGTILFMLLISAYPMWQFGLKEYQKDRIRMFLNPYSDPLGDGYHIIQSIITIGSGKIYGKGYLHGTQSQLEFIPKAHTDFIFSVFAEEWGFIGVCVLLAIFLYFLLSALLIAFKAQDKFGSLLVMGFVIMYFTQIFINMGMEIGILPVVGVTMPLFSYGGSSMLTNLVGVGIALNVGLKKNSYQGL